MSDGESPTPSPRQRPTYGLPGPNPPAAGPDSGSAQGTGPQGPYGPEGAYGQEGPYGQQGSYGQEGPYRQPEPYAHSPSSGPAGSNGTWGHGPSGDDSWAGSSQLPASQPTSAPRRRRRGLIPLIIGLVLLVVIAPATFIGGIVWSMSSVMDDAVSGPTVISGGSGEVEVSANEMLIVYVPQEDAEAAECTAESAGSGSLSTVPSSGTTQFGDGTVYEQSLGVVALEDTTVMISCTGTDGPAYLGPYSLLGVAAPLLIGPIIGVVAGLIGLVLIVIGIVMLVRSRSS